MQQQSNLEPSQESNAPFVVAEKLLQKLVDEEMSGADYLSALERFAGHIQEWRENLSLLALPEGEDGEESKVLLEGALQGLDLIVQGVETCALLAENPQPELAEEGLQQILDGQTLLEQVQGITDINITSAIEDARYLD